MDISNTADTVAGTNSLQRPAWKAPELTQFAVSDATRNDVNQLPYDVTNVRS